MGRRVFGKRPDDNAGTDEDYANYAEITVKTDALRKSNTRIAGPKANWKWKYLLKNIRD